MVFFNCDQKLLNRPSTLNRLPGYGSGVGPPFQRAATVRVRVRNKDKNRVMVTVCVRVSLAFNKYAFVVV